MGDGGSLPQNINEENTNVNLNESSLCQMMMDTCVIDNFWMSACSGSGPGLFLWPCSPLHLGARDPGSWTEFHDDRHLLWAVCHGGKSAYCLYSRKWVLIKGCALMSVCSCFYFWICKGFPEPPVVPLCPCASDSLHRHHTYTAGSHFSGRWTSDGDEWLPQCASKHAGQENFFFFTPSLFIRWRKSLTCWAKYCRNIHHAFSFCSTASLCFDPNSDLHQSDIHNERLCKRNVSET